MQQSQKINELNIIRYNTVVCGKIEELNVKFLEGLKLLSDEGNIVYPEYIEKLMNYLILQYII